MPRVADADLHTVLQSSERPRWYADVDPLGRTPSGASQAERVMPAVLRTEGRATGRNAGPLLLGANHPSSSRPQTGGQGRDDSYRSRPHARHRGSLDCLASCIAQGTPCLGGMQVGRCRRLTGWGNRAGRQWRRDMSNPGVCCTDATGPAPPERRPHARANELGACIVQAAVTSGASVASRFPVIIVDLARRCGRHLLHACLDLCGYRTDAQFEEGFPVLQRDLGADSFLLVK
eukprot:2597148-Prymnesium_polylepis.2